MALHPGVAGLKVVVSGGRGLVGRALESLLSAEGHEVVHITRSPRDASDIPWDPGGGILEAAALEGCDAVVHLAGESVAQRWDDEAKAKILESRVRGTTLIAETLAGLQRPPRVLVSASAVGFYGDRGAEEVDEGGELGEGFLAEVCAAWEDATKAAADAGVRVVHARLGIVLSKEGGALAKMLTPFRLGVGGRIGGGQQYMSWVHIDDVARALLFAIDHEIHAAINVTAPEPVTNTEFTKALGGALRRPTFLPLPRFAAKLALGGEMADEMLLASQRILPKALQGAGFRFEHVDVVKALTALLKD